MLFRGFRSIRIRSHLTYTILAILAVVGGTTYSQNAPNPQSGPQQLLSQTSAQNSQRQPDPAEITQAPATSIQTPANKDAPELAAQDVDATFKVRVNLVEVRVVVRDAKGHAVRG